MSHGFLKFNSGDDSVAWEHSLKTPLSSADMSPNWSILQAGSDALTYSNEPFTHYPTHNENGMKFNSVVDGTTEVGYRTGLSGGNAPIRECDYQGQLSFSIQAAAIDTYHAGWNPNAASYADDNKVFVYGFTETGADNIHFLRCDIGTDRRFAAGVKVHTDADIDLHDGIRQSTSFNGPKIFADSAFVIENDGYVRVQFSWRGDIGVVSIDDVPVAWDTRGIPSDASVLFDRLYLGGNAVGSLDTFPQDVYIKDLVISTEPAEYAVSSRFPVIGVLSDSMFDNVYADSVTGGGVHGGRMGIYKAFNEKGLTTEVVISENAGLATDTITTEVDDHISANPNMRHVFVHLGTNDANQNTAVTQSTIEGDLQTEVIDKYFASSTKVNSLTLIIPPSRYAADSANGSLTAEQVAQRKENQAIYAAAVNAQTAYVATNYPDKTLTIMDMREYIGDDPPANSLRGIHADAIANGDATAGDIHYSNIGSTYLGLACYREMKKVLTMG